MGSLEYKELGRIKVSDTTDIVVSQAVDSQGHEKGITIGKFVESSNFTGHTKTFMIGRSQVQELIDILESI